MDRINESLWDDSDNECLVIQGAEHGHAPFDPVLLRLISGQFNSEDKVCGVTSSGQGSWKHKWKREKDEMPADHNGTKHHEAGDVQQLEIAPIIKFEHCMIIMMG